MVVAAEKCAEPGCTGTIQADGYCDVCGAPAPAPAAAASAPVQAAESDRSASSSRGTHVTTSNRLAAAAIGSSRGTHSTRRLHSARTRASRLGAGITSVPAAPIADPTSAVLANPQVPEEKRFCSKCGTPVGRSRADHPGKAEGFCPKCRTEFSFSPKLKPGKIVGGQYEVVGCIAHGGLGWIYLARDKNVSDRYVVLKGLLDSGDADAYQAAVAEREFLAEVEHPLIVEIYNFVSDDGAGYIVMEYVGGKSLKDILKARQTANNNHYDPFPVDQALAYLVEILPAFTYLHGRGLIYCDFKPDNVVQVGDGLKLIDLGGVRRVDDEQSAIYGTTGYQAPEVPDVGPSVAGDIYTIGRTLAVMSFEFRGHQSTYVDGLPPVEDVALFQKYDSLYRLLAKATAKDPDDRFQAADDLREQMLGVLREVVAIDGGALAAGHSAPSGLFDAPTVAGDTLDWQQLPHLKVDPADVMATWLAGVSVPDPTARLEVLAHAPEDTLEVRLAMARTAIEAANFPLAEELVNKVLASDSWEWRAVWLSGLASLATGALDAALAAFNGVYGQVPGELAPKLALAMACERDDQPNVAEQLYAVCARTDANYTAAAAFGLARLRAKRADVDGALTALDLIAPTSRAYVDARRQRAALLVSSGQGLDALAAAIDSIASITMDPADRQQLLVRVLEGALDGVRRHGPRPDVMVAGVPATERLLRSSLEQAYRHLAEMTDDRRERVHLVDRANRVRPRTMV